MYAGTDLPFFRIRTALTLRKAPADTFDLHLAQLKFEMITNRLPAILGQNRFLPDTNM
jgi:hypothetical protein